MTRPDRARQAAPVADRRAGGRRIDPVLLLAFVIPLLTVAVLATVDPSPTEQGSRSPSPAPLTSRTLVCPAAQGGADVVAVASGEDGAAGPVEVRGGDDLTLQPGRTAERRVRGSSVLRGRDVTAPGLLAARGGVGGGIDCPAPASDVWFAGVGAGPEHSSVLTLHNPDAGPALADVTVLTSKGLREVSRLRGVAVEPRGEVSLDLATLLPEPDDLTVRVTVSRGRLASWVVDRVVPLGSGARALGWLPPAAAPDTSLVVPGVGRGPGERVLVLTNAGEAQTMVRVRAVTPESEFDPKDLPEVSVPPGATVTVDLSRFLRSSASADVLGLRLESQEPVTGVLRTRVAGRLSYAVASTPLRERGALLVDAGPKRLVLAGATEAGEVRVVQRTVSGRALPERAVQVGPDRGARVPLAARARYVEVVVAEGSVSGAVEGTGGELAWVRPVTELVTDTWVPHVAPALY